MPKIHDTLPDGFEYATQAQQLIFEGTDGIVFGASKVALVRAPEAVIAAEEELLRAGDPDGCFPPAYHREVAVENTARLAVRLHPPKTVGTLLRRPLLKLDLKHEQIALDSFVDWYKAEYHAGWVAGKRPGESTARASGKTSHSWDDGYLDARAGRLKWHLTHCPDHDECGEA